MNLKKIIATKYKNNTRTIDGYIKNFNSEGENFGNQDRNALKLFSLDGVVINIKSFKIPNAINQVAYKFFRKSKAQRSFEYANILIKKNIGTPQPIAYYECETSFLFKKSYYVSEHQAYDLTYRELTTNLKYPNHEIILRAFTRFTFNLHENGIHFLDHSPGNTLINKTENGYHFYLVDLNRMKFGNLDFKTRISNFSRLTIHKDMVEVMSDEYAKCTGIDKLKIFDLMWTLTQKFQEKYYRKIRIKRRLKFWQRV